MKSTPWTKPKLGLAPKSGTAEPIDTLTQFQAVRRTLEHCNMLMKEMEAGSVRDGASIFARAVARLLSAAQSFESMQATAQKIWPTEEPKE